MLLLRLTVPADIYHHGILAEADGVDLCVELEEVEAEAQKVDKRQPESLRSPQHRKSSRRIRSRRSSAPTATSPHAPKESHVPTTQDVAKSFLQEELLEEKRQLEALYMSQSRRADEESIISDVSDESSGATGTGTGLGLPAFLAGFLQGIVDRFQIRIRNVDFKLNAHLPDTSADRSTGLSPVTLKMSVAHIDVDSAGSTSSHPEAVHVGQRCISLRGFSLDLICEPSMLAGTLPPPVSTLPELRRSHPRSPTGMDSTCTQASGSPEPSVAHDDFPSHPDPVSAPMTPTQTISHQVVVSPTVSAGSMSSSRARYADANEEEDNSDLAISTTSFDIRPGEDNVSWTSRRSQGSSDHDHLWTSVLHDPDLPDSTAALQDLSTSVYINQETHELYHQRNNPDVYRTAGESQFLEGFTSSAPQSSGLSHDSVPLDTNTSRTASLILGNANVVPESGQISPNEADLTQSRIYSQEEADSMYMSAMSQEAPRSPDLRMLPGQWGSALGLTVDIESHSLLQTGRATHPAKHVSINDDDEVEDKAPTPRLTTIIKQASSSTTDLFSTSASLDEDQKPSQNCPRLSERQSGVYKQLLTIDFVDLWLPKNANPKAEDASRQPDPDAAYHESTTSGSHPGSRMPGSFSTYGAFSQYAEEGASKRLHSSFLQESYESTVPASEEPSRTNGALLQVDIGTVEVRVDTSVVSMLYQLQAVASAGTGSLKSTTDSPQDTSRSHNLCVKIDFLRLSMFEHMIEIPLESLAPMTDLNSSDGHTPLLRLNTHALRLTSNPQSPDSHINIDAGKLSLGIGDTDILSFREMPTSQSGRGDHSDVSVGILRSKSTVRKRRVLEFTIKTRPIEFSLGLAHLDETFESFGGLSGIMEKSSSMLSSGASLNNDQSVSPPRRGVRFEGDVDTSSDSPEIKLNARIGGVTAKLKSKACALEVRLSTTRVVSRANYLVISVGNAALEGPQLSSHHETPSVFASIDNIRLEYLFSPEESDLDRLLSLLTPSKNKYENDDDILLDTLLRQRRKGAVFRVKIGHVSGDVTDWSFINSLRSLGDEMTKLSAVTKYLPEDDRPGLLILPRVQSISLHLPLNDHFGKLDLLCEDFQAAHIGIPALFAFSIGTILVGRKVDEVAIVHELVPTASSDKLPMIMARMIGDEAEPTLKVKLFNLCVEYSVSTLLALIEIDIPVNPEDMASDLAASMMHATRYGESAPSPANLSEASDRPVKKMGIEVLFHDCAIGLQPHEQSAKGLFILANTKFSTMFPPDETLTATLDLRKASLHIVNRIADPTQLQSTLRPRANTTMLSDRLHSFISGQGFVPISSIMSAKASVNIVEIIAENARCIDVELRDELFLLETCADSQQTLVAILNGLAPLMPPSQEPKFRTEPMTVEDMMASFSGDAFVRPGTPHSALFDAEDQSPLRDVDDLLVDSSMTSSLYGPTDAIFDAEDTEDLFGGTDYDRETVASLLEEDPFEITDAPETKRLNDDMLCRSLRKQCSLGNDSMPLELRPYYVNDDQLDRTQVQSTVLGAPNRLNTPSAAFLSATAEPQGKRFPLQVRVRDVHIIWNLYDGYDWEQTRNTISTAVEEVEQKLEERKINQRRSADPEEDEESVIGDFLFNSIYIGVPATRDASDLRRQINRNIDDLASDTESYATSGTSRPTRQPGGLQGRPRPRNRRLKLDRSKSHKLCFELKGVSVDFFVHPPGSGEVQSSIDVRIRDFEIFDNVPTSTWRKFLTYYNDEGNMREMMKPMIHLELLNVRPVPDLAATEIAIRVSAIGETHVKFNTDITQVSVLPLRLHVDQDALEFMTRFFEFKDDTAKAVDKSAEPPFIQRIEINTVDLCLDYKPKKIDYGGLRSGHASEFKNLVILDRAKIKLKHAIIYGLRGFDALHPTLSDIWTPDVIRNQLPGVLAGLAPLRPLVSLGAGVRDVVAIPVREYKKDGRLVRSIQKGAFHFAKTTTSELARLGAKLAVGTQTVLEGAETLLSPSSASPAGRGRRFDDQSWNGDDDDDDEERQQRVVSNYADQPLGVLQGLRSARRYLERDLLTAVDAFIAVQGEVLDSGSATGAAQAVARHGPTIVLRPVIGASRAIGHTLMGVGNQVDRANVRKVDDVSISSRVTTKKATNGVLEIQTALTYRAFWHLHLV